MRPREKEGDGPTETLGRLPPTNPNLRLLHYEPSRYVIIHKPADVRMDGEFTHTVEKLVLHQLKALQEDLTAAGFGLRFVHRLDYATSGVLLVALSRHAAGVAATQFEKRLVRKRYLALVHGHLHLPSVTLGDVQSSPPHLVFDAAIADTHPASYRMTVGTEHNPGRVSMTKCYPIEYGMYRDAPVTKVCLEPHSGRRHQLRVHCAHAGIPIVGDATYIEDDAVYFHDPHFMPPRMMLHAHELEIALPPRDQTLYGRKSGLRNAITTKFSADDPFTADRVDGLSFTDCCLASTLK